MNLLEEIIAKASDVRLHRKDEVRFNNRSRRTHNSRIDCYSLNATGKQIDRYSYSHWLILGSNHRAMKFF